MSNRIRYDSLLTRYLARALDTRLAGRRLERLDLDPERRRATLSFGEEALVLDLHPTAGNVLVGPTPALGEGVRLARRSTVARVHAPPDERLLILELTAAGKLAGRPRRLIVELLPNQLNLLVLDPADRILAALWKRTAGDRELRPGAHYVPPPPTERLGVEQPLSPEAWRELLGDVAPAERRRTLIARVAWTSPINVDAILGEAARDAGAEALDQAFDRYAALAALPTAVPQLLSTDKGPQPYPLPLPGVPGRHFPTLLDAIAAVAGDALPAAAPAVSATLLERLRRRVDQLESRGRRLAEELAGAAPDAARLRGHGDLLLSQLHLVRKGATEAEIPDFEGGTVRLTLDPSLTPVENANRLYEQARKRERAAERLPTLLARVEAEHDRLAALLARAEAGAADAEEVEAAAGTAATPRKGAREETQTLPYRTYRTSGGLELRVGRGSRSNDELTFHHSSPNDIWLHARDVGGAHVILRWDDANANPPARDLNEAAVLAALNSKARTSGTVAVDWTRRKYVRKPRKAPPGLVTMERAKTIFVEPDEALERTMRV